MKLFSLALGGTAQPVQTPVPDQVLTGQTKIVTSGTAVVLGSGKLFNGVIVTAKPGNAASILVGGSNGVLRTDDGTGNGYALVPGQSMSFACADLANLWINGAAGDSVYYSGN